jgi:hypothetical protein
LANGGKSPAGFVELVDAREELAAREGIEDKGFGGRERKISGRTSRHGLIVS